MNTSSKGFVAPLLLVIIAVLLLSGGTYVYTQSQKSPAPSLETSGTMVTEATTTPASVPAQTVAVPAPQANNDELPPDIPPTVVPISNPTGYWGTHVDAVYHASFRYPEGWEIKTVSLASDASTVNRYEIRSREGQIVDISIHKNFSKLMLSSQNGDILTYSDLQDAWVPEVGTKIIPSSLLKNHFITLPAAIYGATWHVYSNDIQNGQFVSDENGAPVSPVYQTASGYPVYEFDRQNGDNTTFYFIVPLPNGNAVYVYCFGTSVLPGLDNIVKTITAS